jgi:RNA polymerase sigma-70 factor (ECF subfamily)
MDQRFQNEDFSHLLSDKGDLFLKYLFDKYYPELCKLSFKYVGRTDIAEDVVQDVFINIWNKRTMLNYSGNIKPCFIRSVINTSLNYINSKFAKQNFVDESSASLNLASYNQHDEILGKELNSIIMTAIEQLPNKCRAIFSLSRFSNLTYKEIAKQLDISVKTVEAQISIALKRVHEYLSKYGYFVLILFLLFS